MNNAELTAAHNNDQLIQLNANLDNEIIHYNYLKEAIEIIAYENKRKNFQYDFILCHRKKLRIEYEDIINCDSLEKQLTDIQLSINELEAWHIRTGNTENNNEERKMIVDFLLLDYPSEK